MAAVRASLLGLVLAAGMSWAAGAPGTPPPKDSKPPKLVLRAERDVDGFFSQQAVVFEADRVTIARNSNFLCEPSSTAWLGVFHAPYDARLRAARAQAEQAAARIAPKKAAVEPESPHSLRLYLGEKEVTRDEPFDRTVQRLVESECAKRPARAEKAVSVALRATNKMTVLEITELAGAAKGRVSQVIAAKSACRPQASKVLECVVKGYGTAFLLEP